MVCQCMLSLPQSELPEEILNEEDESDEDNCHESRIHPALHLLLTFFCSLGVRIPHIQCSTKYTHSLSAPLPKTYRIMVPYFLRSPTDIRAMS